MTDKEMKKLSRAELLEMLLAQAREVDLLKQELEAARTQLEQRQLKLDNAGNIAEAALQLNGVFEAAQAAAQQYLDNVSGMESETKRRCQAMKEKTRLECDAMRRDAEKDAAGFWEEIKLKVQDPYRDHVWWQQIMGELDSHTNQNSSGGANEK